MGTAMTGFLSGFLEAKTKFDQLDEQRAARQQQLEVQREELKLRSQAFKGQEAHLALQTRAQEAALAKEIREQQGREELGTFFGQGGSLDDPQGLALAARYLPPAQLIELQKQRGTQADLARIYGQVMPLPPEAAPSRPAVGPSGAPGAALTPPPGLSPAFVQKASAIATDLGIQPDDLMKIMHFETGGTFNPATVNKAGSGATGLIQFMPQTAQALGTTTEALARMTPEQQLDYVHKYLAPYKGKLGNLKDAYMAVLNPAAIGQAPDAVLWKNGTTAYAQNIGLDKEDKGYITVGDATRAVGGAGGAATVPRGRLPQEQPSLVASTASTAGGETGASVMALQQEQTELQARLKQLRDVAPTIKSDKGQAALNREVDNVQQRLRAVSTDLRGAEMETMRARREGRIADIQQQQLTLAQTKEAREAGPQFDKDFAEYFALHHNNQQPRDAMKVPGGAEVVQKSRADFDVHDAERKANAEALKEAAALPSAIKRAEAAKAATPIPEGLGKSLIVNTSIYNSLGKIEAILREGTDLPVDFINLVTEGKADIQKYLQGDPKALTGFIQQYKTKLGAVASNDPRINRFISALANLRDLVIQERSGSSVTGNELERAVGAFSGSLPDLGQAFSLFAENLGNVKERAFQSLVQNGASVRPLSGGKAVYGGLPDPVRLQILRNESRADVPPADPTAPVTAPASRRVIGEPVEVK